MSNEQLLKIKESINKFKQDLSLRQRQLLFYGLYALLALLILLFAYRPLGGKLEDANRELNSLTSQLLSQRNNVTTLKGLKIEGKLMQQREVSLAIDELTEKGRALGLKFNSITPGKLEKSAQGDFKKLPINLKIEAGYASLGKFLAYVEEFPRTIAEVESLSIRSQEKALPNLDLDLVVNLYMEAEDGQE